MARAKRHKTGRKRSQKITLPQFNGDHGTGTQAANKNTVIEALDGPNKMGRRRRVNVIETITSLSQRQRQAADEIQNAYCRNEMLSSGSPLKEQVDASPKPDAVVASQMDAMNRLTRAMKAVRTSERHLVYHICWHNQPGRTSGVVNWQKRFKAAMDRVADHLRY